MGWRGEVGLSVLPPRRGFEFVKLDHIFCGEGLCIIIYKDRLINHILYNNNSIYENCFDG